MAKKFTNKLVEEAIADANAVRESAILAAKAQLEESFTPAIKSLIAKRLKSEADADIKLEDEMKRAIAAGGTTEAHGQEPDDFAAVDTDAVDVPTGKTHVQGELDSSNIGTADNKEPDEFDTSSIGTVGAEKNFEASVDEPSAAEFGGEPAPEDDGLEDMGGEEGGEEGDDEYDEFDLDLESIIKELEADIEALKQANLSGGEEGEEEESEEGEEEEGEEEEKPEMENVVQESVPNKSSEIAGPDNKEPAEFTSSNIGGKQDNFGKEFTGSDLEDKGSAASTYEGQENAAPSPDLKKTSSADTETTHSGQNFMKEGSEEIDEELDLNEILEELEVSTYEQMASEIASLQKENTEFKDAIKFLRSRLTEVNLLNAKLLFTNKLFRKTGLTNEQKVRIVENFDRATTVREVKLVYAALAENVVASRPTKRPRNKVVVTEGSASKSTTSSTAPKQEIITEASKSANRLQFLAGILKEQN